VRGGSDMRRGWLCGLHGIFLVDVSIVFVVS
jgi:hypothetical protein